MIMNHVLNHEEVKKSEKQETCINDFDIDNASNFDVNCMW